MSRLNEGRGSECPVFGAPAEPPLGLHEVLSPHLHKYEKSVWYERLKTCLFFEYPPLLACLPRQRDHVSLAQHLLHGASRSRYQKPSVIVNAVVRQCHFEA